MEMPKPGPAHAGLARLAGTRVGEETIAPSPCDPVGGVATGRGQNRVALDGFAVIQDCQPGRRGVTNMLGHGIFTCDLGNPARYRFLMEVSQDGVNWLAFKSGEHGRE